MPMEVMSEGESRTDETTVLFFPIRLWMPSLTTQPRVYDQEADVPGLRRLWAGIRVFLEIDAVHTVERR